MSISTPQQGYSSKFNAEGKRPDTKKHQDLLSNFCFLISEQVICRFSLFVESRQVEHALFMTWSVSRLYFSKRFIEKVVNLQLWALLAW